MTKSTIRHCAPFIDESDIESVQTALKYFWGERRGEGIRKAEDLICKITSQNYTCMTSHCTGALHTAIRVLDLNHGDEIIAPNLSWVASISPAVHEGCTIKLVDVDRETGCISPTSVQKVISRKTKAIIGVNLFGNACNWAKLKSLAIENDCQLLEDNAEGLGGFFGKFPLGSFGDISCTSYHATKIITAGQGGSISTSNPDYVDKIKSQVHHGILKKTNEDPFYWSSELGCNYTYSDMQAALVYSQLKKINILVNNRINVYSMYKNALHDISNINLHFQNINGSNRWMILASIESCIKEKVVQQASNHDVELRPCFYKLSDMPPFRQFKAAESPNSDFLSRYCFSLPNGMHMDSNKVDRVVECLKSISKGN